jgi:hypothetical protein
MGLTLIGDAHGKYDRYVKIARKRDFTIQLGDLGFRYACLNNLDPECHKVLGGNHDNYSAIVEYPHYLGDYGNGSLGGVDFFFYRGAYSIDRQYRTIGIDWWPEEQLRIEDFMRARELYRETKPDVVLTHDCPETISPMLLPPGSQMYQNTTGWALQEFLSIHSPRLWIFGHYHQSTSIQSGDTKFVCLDELETLDL